MFYRLSEWKLLKINCIEMFQRKKGKKKKKLGGVAKIIE